MINIMKNYTQLYREFSKEIKENSTSVFNRYRDEAFTEFEVKGFPSRKDEAYLNSRLTQTLDIDYGININRLNFKVDKNDLFECKIPSINATLSFMINDKFYISENQRLKIPEGVIFCSMSEAEKLYPEVINKYMFALSEKSKDSFTNFNTSFVQDGYFLYITKNTIVEQPLQIINMLRSQSPLITFMHNLIVVEEGAELKMLVCDHAANNVDFFSSKVMEVFVEDNAKFEYYSLENTNRKTNNIMQMFVSQKNSSNVIINNLLLVNATSRNQVEVDIDGENASLFLGGMLISDGKQEAENNTVIRHNKPNSTSNEMFKYILDDKSHGIFSGIIVVDKEAQKTLSRQTNRSICLTEGAVMNSRPQLEIYADDVKCGHGATNGQLDTEAMFYMKQRGVDEKTARLMLLSAFVQDVINEISIDVLRERLTGMIERRLRNDTSHCEDCFVH